jgi:hypothetical protein
VAAQDQRVEFLFAAQVSGQAELKKLTDAVDGLRKEMEALKAANGGVGAATQQFTRSIGNASSHVQAYQKHLDAQAKAMRNHRQGTQQLGMQFNDLGTSISTGASPIQAFNQQIGQIGYAMSMMGGKMGAVGSFLAGPWGAAITIATMVLAPLIEGLFKTGDAAKKAAEETERLEKHERTLAGIASDLVVARARIDQAMGKNVDSYLVGQQEAVNLARIDIASAKKSIDAAKMRLEAARANIAANKTMQTMGTGLRAPGISIFGRIREYFQDNEGKIQKENEDLSAIEVSMRKLELSLNSSRGDSMERANSIADKNAQKGLAAARRAEAEAERIAKEAEAAREKEANSIQSFMDKIGKVGMKEIPAYQRDIAMLEKDFFELSKVGQAATIAPFKAAVESIEMQHYSDMLKADAENAGKMLNDLPDFVPSFTKEMEDIISRADEMDKSFEAIGNTVSDAFKGMLTGAMSWKDGMRSLIGAVIDELWKLFVVQQIVGLISGALRGGTATPSASTASQSIGMSTPGNFKPLTLRARGGPVSNNTPYMVGEQGPELFVPSGNGTIIPNNNMRGGGGGSSFNISVDARGSNDPAAVRAQVQQGILEAAPAIIAAAESRTIAGLRRPRLGGAMQ